MKGSAYRHDEALEPELGLEDVVERVAIAATVRIVDTVVAAHNVAGTCMEGVLEGPGGSLSKVVKVSVPRDDMYIPEVQLVQSLVVYIG